MRHNIAYIEQTTPVLLGKAIDKIIKKLTK